jgi:hypothetical protein
VYQNNQGIELGAVKDVNGWYTFLNYYFWMQANVDAQIGRVINALNNAPNTIIIFSSDHGDYAGSHWIHGKGFALYDESISVPLYIKFPGQKGIPLMVPYACSSVDILPFVYIMALGNNTWRTNSKDLVAYLWNRESISDFIFKPNPVQRRLSSIPNANPGVNNSGANQPYILHTTDEGFVPVTDPTGKVSPVPTHAIAFRTVDYSVDFTTVLYGGGKLGMYSSWNYGNPPPGSTQTKPTQPDPAVGPEQFEFYNYSSGQSLPANYGETGNQVQITSGVLTPGSESAAYQNSFNAIMNSELYSFSTYNGDPAPLYIIATPSGAYSKALATYLAYVAAAQAGQTPTDTTWQK